MLTRLRIHNFKLWEDTKTIFLSPITLFFGANSSGKSSIGQFLMMLKQTAALPDRKVVFFPGGSNSPVQLGSFQEMVFNRDKELTIKFAYEWNLPTSMVVADPIKKETIEGNHLAFVAEAKLANGKDRRLLLDNFWYGLRDKQDNRYRLKIGMRPKESAKSEFEVFANNYQLVRNKGRVWSPGPPVRFYGFPDEVIAYYQNAEFVQDLNLRQERLFESIFYLGPLRTKAERLYSWTLSTPESVGYAGENTVAAILSARDRQISFGYRMKSKRFEEIIAESLQELGLIQNFKVLPISEQRQEYEVKVKTKTSKQWVDLIDVGFGVSQVLPVLVQCFYAPKNSIIIMEQPEIHLHPSAQSALADILIKAINSREDGEDRNIQLIVETHSEHFLRRLQRRIAEDTISKNRVSAYFAKIARNVPVLEKLEIDEFGNISNWPQDFFGDEATDIAEQALAGLEKRKKARTKERK